MRREQPRIQTWERGVESPASAVTLLFYASYFARIPATTVVPRRFPHATGRTCSFQRPPHNYLRNIRPKKSRSVLRLHFVEPDGQTTAPLEGTVLFLGVARRPLSAYFW